MAAGLRGGQLQRGYTELCLGIFNSEGADAASRGFRPPRPGTGGAAGAPGARPV